LYFCSPDGAKDGRSHNSNRHYLVKYCTVVKSIRCTILGCSNKIQTSAYLPDLLNSNHENLNIFSGTHDQRVIADY